MVLLTSALFVSIFTLIPVPVLAAGIGWDTAPLGTGPPGTFVSFAAHSTAGAISSCSLVPSYTKFFSPSVAASCNVAGDGQAAGSITGFFKIRAPTEISAANPLPGNLFTYFWALNTNDVTIFDPSVPFVLTQSIGFSLSSSGPWTVGSVPFAVLETQTVYIHGWGFDPDSTGCSYGGLPGGSTELTCSVNAGEMSGGFIPPVTSAGVYPAVIITGNSGFGDISPAATVSVVTGPAITVTPSGGSTGLQVTIRYWFQPIGLRHMQRLLHERRRCTALFVHSRMYSDHCGRLEAALRHIQRRGHRNSGNRLHSAGHGVNRRLRG